MQKSKTLLLNEEANKCTIQTLSADKVLIQTFKQGQSMQEKWQTMHSLLSNLCVEDYTSGTLTPAKGNPTQCRKEKVCKTTQKGRKESEFMSLPVPHLYFLICRIHDRFIHFLDTSVDTWQWCQKVKQMKRSYRWRTCEEEKTV